MKLTPANVSVVVQGPVGPWLPDVLASVRAHLPGAELVLSTWQGTDLRGYDADTVVESVDPGSAPYRGYGGVRTPRLMNTNRMLRSSRAGVERATRPFTLKLRTDTPLMGGDVLSWWGSFPRRGDALRVFDERVLCPSVATRPGRRMPGFLFHPSDCVHFGLTTDVQRLWAVDEVDEEASAAYWLNSGRDRSTIAFQWNVPRYFNEQALWLSALRANGHDVHYPHAGYVGLGSVESSEAALVNNFLVLEPWQMGIALPKLRRLVAVSDPATFLRFDEWVALYEGQPATSHAA